LIGFDRQRLDQIFSGLKDKRLLVIGDLMIDEYLIGQVSKISTEAPVPVVTVQDQETRLGGAANVGLNVASLGCIPVVVGAIGDDLTGDLLLELLTKNGMMAEGVIRTMGRPTTVKTRIYGGAQQIVRVDREMTNYLNAEQEKRLFEKIYELLDSVDGVILEDYNKGVLTYNILTKIIKQANTKGLTICVDPKFNNFLNYQNITIFKPNIREIEEVLAAKILNEQDLLAAGKLLVEKLKAKSILITRGAQGMTLFEDDNSVTHLPARARNVADISGAADTVIGMCSAAMVAGATIKESAILANFAAGLVCEEVGAIPVNKDKLVRECSGHRN
jgi:rfaE bifunctional protein kinase chain/domain